MGDKNPKTKTKQANQKQTKNDASQKKKNDAQIAKQPPKK